MQRLLALALSLAILALSAGGAAAKPTVQAPKRVMVGDRVVVKARGLVDGRYTLSLVARVKDSMGAHCLARIGKRRRVTKGRATFRGKIPASQRCYDGPDQFLGRATVPPGRYRFVVGVKDGGAAFDGTKSFVRKVVRVVD